ncbi:VPLPA-CTERM sorting domain-containing protein [Methylobacter luteus]|uniref:VPLPA-CTERM sorting domain-containing protein n=1 Tax=Methylobacter luteus TaxID=415 RepID=UPI0012DD73FE|nr:VPLPA-CTERM sorting domain-containing protein [Methylobacter luteus]
MKKIYCVILMIISISITVTAAEAASYTDTYNPTDMLLGTGDDQTSSYSWEFDITDSGFNPLTQDVTNALVNLQLRDDKGPQDGAEKLSFSAESTSLAGNANANHDLSFNLFDNGNALLRLSDIGKLLIVLTATSGDFIFEAATLHVTATDVDVNSVPLPAAVWLFGSGLAGLIGAAARRKSTAVQA